MKWYILAPLLCLVAARGIAEGNRASPIGPNVVNVHVIVDAPDLLVPWQTEGIQHASGSGVVLDGRRVLTNAHVVENAVAIEVKRAGRAARYPARVSFVSDDADLAVLEVPNKRFFEDVNPIPIGEMPQLRQSVDVYGFPIGGETLSITSGIVSRVEVDLYSQSFRDLLSVQIDAAMNSGNSGGPVVSQGKIVGIAMQALAAADADNVGYMVPAPVVEHFLKDVADGRYDGFPWLGAELQDMESSALRASFGMKDSQTGGLVVNVDYDGPVYGVVKPGDIILSIDGRPLANDLTIDWEGIGRLDYRYAIQSKQVDDTIQVTLLRGGKELAKRVRLKRHRPLVPGHRVTEKPRYLIYAGLVFRPLSEELLEADELYADSAVYAVLENVVTKERSEIIVLDQVLPVPVNRGYHEWGGETIRSVNGIVPRDLDHLAQIIDNAKGRWLRIVAGDGFIVVLDNKAARRSSEATLHAYGIPADRYLGPGTSPQPRRRRPRR